MGKKERGREGKGVQRRVIKRTTMVDGWTGYFCKVIESRSIEMNAENRSPFPASFPSMN